MKSRDDNKQNNSTEYCLYFDFSEHEAADDSETNETPSEPLPR
jgi:hypothetical protein